MATIDARKKQVVAGIIRRLHEGLPVEEARDTILREVGRLTSAQITDIEQSLIDEGVSPEEISKFCNVHALLFESALEESIATPDSPTHPVALLKRENREIEKATETVRIALARGDAAGVNAGLETLKNVDRHYAIKENALFPFLEKHGFPGPSKVMWSKHDEVRALLKAADATPNPETVTKLIAEIEGMIFKEESILFPAALERLTNDDWRAVYKSCDEIGFPFLVSTSSGSATPDPVLSIPAPRAQGEIVTPTGRFSLDELVQMLNVLPLDITFVDADDRVRYFSQSKDRIFVRATSVLGREVKNCHPPHSVDRVVRIVESFRDGSQDHADFWITMKGKFIYIRYFAVRDASGKYLGTLEVTQDLTEIRTLSGEKRL